jgi:hypothetical protein
MREHKIKALRGYKAPRHIAGRPSTIVMIGLLGSVRVNG